MMVDIKQIESEEFKTICLNMLISFSKICEKENLHYFLDYGTLLGSIRHDGFIPWDDDIDVSMPRDDYNKLIKIFKNNENVFGDNIRLALPNNNYNIYKPWANLIDLRTITDSSTRKKEYNFPVWIDIFPLDYYNNYNEAKKRAKKIKYLISKARTPIVLRNTFKDKLKGILLFSSIKSSVKYLDKADKLASKYSQGSYLINFYSYPHYGFNETITIDYFYDYEYHNFEKYKFRIPKKYDDRLKNMYGNYLELPPIEKRKSHFTKAYWKKD